MGEIRVVPPTLESVARSLSTGADGVRSVASSVNGAEGAAAATGHPGAAGAYGRMCAIWSAELERAADSFEALGGLTAIAAMLYRATDSQAIPDGG